MHGTRYAHSDSSYSTEEQRGAFCSSRRGGAQTVAPLPERVVQTCLETGHRGTLQSGLCEGLSCSV